MRSATALALMTSVVAAENVVTSLFLPVFHQVFQQQHLVVSIVGGDASATTYSVACADGTPSDECSAGRGFTLIEGPETASLNIVGGASSRFFNIACDLNTRASQAICNQTNSGMPAIFPKAATATFTSDGYASAWMAVTVTAGSASGAPATTAASATAPTASATNSGTTPAATSGTTTASVAASSGMSTGSSATAAQSSASSSSSVSTGGMPQVTGNAHWAVGGAAVAMALAAL